MYNNGVLSLTDDESGRKMEILLAGNTGYLTGEWIEQTFLGTHVLICGDTQFKYHKGKVPILRLQEHRAEEIDLKQYELDRIVYFIVRCKKQWGNRGSQPPFGVLQRTRDPVLIYYK